MDCRIVLLFLGTLIASGSALMCYSCSGVGGTCQNNVTNGTNNTDTCSSLQTRCGTTFTKADGDFVSFSRGCKTTVECICALAGTSTGICTRCCKTDKCNTTNGSSTAQAQGVVTLLTAAIISMLVFAKQ